MRRTRQWSIVAGAVALVVATAGPALAQEAPVATTLPVAPPTTVAPASAVPAAPAAPTATTLAPTTTVPAPAPEAAVPGAGAPEVVVPTNQPTDSRPVTGDFDGTGRSTVFWYSKSSVDRRWHGKTDRTFAEMEPEVAGGDYRPFTGDFNGDRFADIFFWGPGPAADALWYGKADGTYTKVAAPSALDYVTPLPGDFNGDGRTDVAAFYDYGGGRTKGWIFPGTPDGLSKQSTVFWDSGNGNWETNRTRFVGGDAMAVRMRNNAAPAITGEPVVGGQLANLSSGGNWRPHQGPGAPKGPIPSSGWQTGRQLGVRMVPRTFSQQESGRSKSRCV